MTLDETLNFCSYNDENRIMHMEINCPDPMSRVSNPSF